MDGRMPGVGVTGEPSEAQLQLRRRGGRREEERRRAKAELEEALLGGLAGGVERRDGPRATAGAAQHLVAEGPLVEGGPVDAVPTRAGG